MFRLKDHLTRDERRIVVFLALVILLGLAVKYVIVNNSEEFTGNLHAEEIQNAKVDIRTCSKSDLMGLPGIGEVKAVRIIEYRRKKPFSSVDELMGVKGIGEKTFLKLRPYLVEFGADSLDTVEKEIILSDSLIDINHANLEELMTLPGIGEVKAKRIIDRRTNQGKFSSTEELLEIKGIGEKTLAKLMPLIKCER